MIAKLKRQFITAAMASIFLVLALIIGVINVVNYHHVNETIDERLHILLDNNGSFGKFHNDNFMIDDGMPPDGEDTFVKPFGNRDNNKMSLETPFDTRYFTVTVDDSGNIIDCNLGNIASISEDSAKEYTSYLFVNNKASGFYGNFKYDSKTLTDGTLYVFLNAERELESFHSFLRVSIGISLISLILVLLLIIYFAGVIVKPMAESYEKQKQFITDANHELKTPLTIIDASLEVIEMEHGESDWTDSIRNQVKRLTSLTEKLVALSRMDEENTKLDMAPFNLSEAILDTAEPFKSVAIKQSKELSINVKDDITFNGNEASIRQAVSLLIDNALKYAKDDSTIKICLNQTIKGKIITVENKADNLKPGRYDMLFERFYRADSSRNSKTGGFGIGLSVVKAIVTSHKGKISAKSPDGKSIIFKITLF